MPYEWLPKTGVESRLHLWPYRSLTPRGFATFIAIIFAMLAIPLVGLLGAKARGGFLPLIALEAGGIWRSPEDGLEYRTGQISDPGAA